MSTNGLLLPEKADEIIEVGIDSLTVTVNAVVPEIEARLNDGIRYHGNYYSGAEAATILIRNQLEGRDRDKVNTAFQMPLYPMIGMNKT